MAFSFVLAFIINQRFDPFLLGMIRRGRPVCDFDEPVTITQLKRNATNAGSSRFIWSDVDVDGDGRVDVIYTDNVSRTIESTSRRGALAV